MYKIKVGKLLEELGKTKEIKDQLELHDPDNSFELSGPIDIDITLIGLKDSILLRGRANFTLLSLCARCGKSFPEQMQIKLEELYKREENILHFDESDKEIGPEDLYFVIEADETIDIEEVLRQNIIMALPIKPICSINCKPVSLSIGEVKQDNAFSNLKNLLDRKE
jgi:uncharacterized protein